MIMARISLNMVWAFLWIASSGVSSSGIEYDVVNEAAATGGGARFCNEIGEAYSKQVMSNATEFIWKVFQEKTEDERKDVKRVSLVIDVDGGDDDDASGNDIHVGAGYLEDYKGELKRELTGIIYHEMTHVWQWPGNSSTPQGLIEGIADYVRLKAGYAAEQWAGKEKGRRWDEGFVVTARFLDYCNAMKEGFVAELNKKMRFGYSGIFFVELLGKTVDQLWRDYTSLIQP